MLARWRMTSPTDRTHLARTIEWTLAGILTVLVVYAHTRVLQHAGPLWRDEISSLRLATMPTLSAFWSTLVYDPFPALFFAVVRFWEWAGLGASDQGLRELGFLIGLGITGAFWMTSWSLKKAPPILALALFGLSPVALVWGDSLRAYGFSCVWNIVSIGLLWKLVCERPRISHILLATLAALLSVHSLFPNAFFLFALAMAAIAVAARRGWWRAVVVILAVGATAAASLLPYIPIIRGSQNWTGLARASINVHWILHMLFQALHSGGSVATTVWIGCAVAACAALIIGLVRPSRLETSDKNFDLMVYAGLTFIIAFVAIITFFRVVSWTTSVWYYVPLMATAAVCFDAVSATFRRGAMSVIGIWCVAIIAALFTAPLTYRASAVRLTNADLVATKIAVAAGKEDLIVVDNYFFAISFNRYYHGLARWLSVPDLADFSLHRWDLLTEAMRHPQPIQRVAEEIQRTLRAGHNVFIVGTTAAKWRGTPPPDLPPAPVGTSGWTLWRYLGTWRGQIAYAVQAHAQHGVILRLDSLQPVSSGETLKAMVVTGWREEARVLD